jgi:hypothetical protein
MEEAGFVKYETVLAILKDAGFFGFTAHREAEGRRVVYSFRSVKWYRTKITVTILKLEPKKIGSKKIVIGIDINGENINGIGDFQARIRNLGNKNARNKQQKI